LRLGDQGEPCSLATSYLKRFLDPAFLEGVAMRAVQQLDKQRSTRSPDTSSESRTFRLKAPPSSVGDSGTSTLVHSGFACATLTKITRKAPCSDCLLADFDRKMVRKRAGLGCKPPADATNLLSRSQSEEPVWCCTVHKLEEMAEPSTPTPYRDAAILSVAVPLAPASHITLVGSVDSQMGLTPFTGYSRATGGEDDADDIE
jgi:hypothetical protein